MTGSEGGHHREGVFDELLAALDVGGDAVDAALSEDFAATLARRRMLSRMHLAITGMKTLSSKWPLAPHQVTVD